MTTCDHDVCVTGTPLGAQCSQCAATVCMADGFCCNQSWDGICVQEAQSLCGAACGTCAQNGSMCAAGPNCCSGNCVGGICQKACNPDGGTCIGFADCCSGVCANGTCGQQCKADGFACMTPGECCTGQCANGVCGAQQCPSGGGACNDCVASQCCGQLQSCFQSPNCINDVTCFTTCIQNGGNPQQCLLQCVNSPEAIQFLICLGSNCGQGVCF